MDLIYNFKKADTGTQQFNRPGSYNEAMLKVGPLSLRKDIRQRIRELLNQLLEHNDSVISEKRIN